MTGDEARGILDLLLRDAGQELVGRLHTRLLAEVTAADLAPARATLVAALQQRVADGPWTYEIDAVIKQHVAAATHERLESLRADVAARVAAEVARRIDEVVARQVDAVIDAELADARARLAERLGRPDADR